MKESPNTSYSEQLRICKAEGVYGSGEGPEIELEPAFPNKKFRDYVRKHGSLPKLHSSLCKRFSGMCSSQNPACVKLRSKPNVLTEIYKAIYNEAYRMANDGHLTQKRKDGKPYMTHIDAVIANVEKYLDEHGRTLGITPDLFWLILAVAALHDLKEDHGDKYPIDTIRTLLRKAVALLLVSHDGWMLFKIHSEIDQILSAVDSISKKEKGEEEYADYVLRVQSNVWSTIVKLCDLKHNMSDLGPGSMRDKYSLTQRVLELEMIKLIQKRFEEES